MLNYLSIFGLNKNMSEICMNYQIVFYFVKLKDKY